MDDFDRTILQRVPLAEATLLLLAHATRDPFLEELYDRHRGRCYEQVLSFPTLVRLIGDALIQHRGSGRKSCEHAAERDEMPVTPSAFYRKLGRIPLPVSQALVSDTTMRIAPLSPARDASPIPASLRGMTLLPVDGKKIKNVAKRTEALRDLPGSVLGAKVLVALRLEDGLAVAMEADPDGEANDCPLVAGLLAQVRHVVAGTRLFIADRQFCGAEQLDQFAADGDHYLVRRTTTARFTPDPRRPASQGIDSRGRHYSDAQGILFTGAKARRVRQLTLVRPGAEAVILVTDLLDEEALPATDLLEAYLMRWGIERVFQQITEVFSLASLIGTTPEAVVFQCGFCLLLYNALRVVRDILAATHDRERESVSLEQVFGDARDQITTLRVLGALGMARAGGSRSMSDDAVRAELTRLLGGIWSDRWLKAPAKKKAPAPKTTKRSGAHTSILRAKEAHRQRQAARDNGPREAQ
jgi:Transposase DDE domain